MLFPEMEAGVFSPDAEARPATLPMAGTILFVENNDAIRLLVRNAFEKRGYRVIEARDGNEAILQSRLHTEAIDLLISDIAMPAMDGPTLARKLGALHPEMRVILISSRPIDPSAVGELAGTNTRFVRKPFTQRDLLTQAEGLLNGNQKSARN
jgi:CheY-like chemotaxis protein